MRRRDAYNMIVAWDASRFLHICRNFFADPQFSYGCSGGERGEHGAGRDQVMIRLRHDLFVSLAALEIVYHGALGFVHRHIVKSDRFTALGFLLRFYILLLLQ